MRRVVADTNVIIFAILFRGLPGAFLDLSSVRAFQLVTSSALLDELDGKLRTKFKQSPQNIGHVRSWIEGFAEVVKPTVVIDLVVDDPDDNRVVECAIAGTAKYIVSGDRHLLKLRKFAEITILTIRQFMDTLPTPDPQ